MLVCVLLLGLLVCLLLVIGLCVGVRVIGYWFVC
jgi:hypothetical protein